MGREQPLLLETLRALAEGRVQVGGGQVLDAQGSPAPSLCLNEEVRHALSRQSESTSGDAR